MRRLQKFGQRFASLLGIMALFAAAIPTAQAVDAQQTWLQFSILEVKCLDETEPEWFGDDEIALGGTAASKYGVDKITYRNLGDYEDGTTRQYTDWIFTEIPFTADTDQARVLLSLVELDPGGGKEAHLEELVNTEYALAKQQVITDFLTLLTVPDPAVGRAGMEDTFIPGFELLLGLAIQTAVETVVTHIINNLWQDLISRFDDDFFTPKAIAAPDFTDPSRAANPAITGQVRFEDHGGTYQVTYQWQLVTKTAPEGQTTGYQPYLSLAAVVTELQKAYNTAIAGRTIFLPLVITQ